MSRSFATGAGMVAGAAVVLGLVASALSVADRQPGNELPPAAPDPPAAELTPAAALPAPQVAESASAENLASETDALVEAALMPEYQRAIEDVQIPDESPAEVVPAADTDVEYWYAFWSPFRSEIAAQGFVAELQKHTSLDYRVMRLDRATYEVAFAYQDDADVATKLAEITAATGLEIADSGQ